MDAERVALASRDEALSVPRARKEAKMMGKESCSGVKGMRFQFPAEKRGIQGENAGKWNKKVAGDSEPLRDGGMA